MIGGQYSGFPILRFFSTLQSKPMPLPHEAHPVLKNEASPSEKQPPPPPLKGEALFHEMISRKSIINNNLNLAKILENCV